MPVRPLEVIQDDNYPCWVAVVLVLKELHTDEPVAGARFICYN
jgi:hypothetical protein